jgi:membrane-associated phospholipid phosphatase
MHAMVAPAADSKTQVTAPPIKPPETPDKLGVTQLAVGFVVALLAMLFFGFLADRIYLQESFALDTYANPFLHSISSPMLDSVMNGITSLGSVEIVGAFYVLAIVLLLSRGLRTDALFLTVAIGGSVALNGIMKLIFERPRPQLPWASVLPDFSFPSGHSMNSLVFYLAIALILWTHFGRRVGVVAVVAAVVIAVAVGFSRIYLGYHYLSDVVGGFAAGLAWLLVVVLAFEVVPRTWAKRPWARRRGQRST